MDIGISQVYKDKDMYRFILSSKDGQKGYEHKEERNAVRARAMAVKTIKADGHKVYQVSC